MTKQTFDPSAAASSESGIFGLPFQPQDARLILLPVPWEVTTSYGGGTSKGPASILEASKQVDLFDLELGNTWELGIHMLSENRQVKAWNKEGKLAAAPIIKAGGEIGTNKKLKSALNKVNSLSEKMNGFVFEQTQKLLSEGKMVGLVGGDHSTPYGCIQAHCEKYPNMGVLHFDAHADLRQAYEGFEYSHASIMYNVMKCTQLKKLVQVGIRDFCEEEYRLINNSSDRIITFFDTNIQKQKFSGSYWDGISESIVAHLPQEVYISFDIDALEPALCPNTGTPVPGGLSFNEALATIRAVVKSGRKIVGFDLNEVAPSSKGGDWDANVGARLLYKLSLWALASNKD